MPNYQTQQLLTMFPPPPWMLKPFILILIFASFLALSAEATGRSFNPPGSLPFVLYTEVKVGTKVTGKIGADALLLDYEPPGANPAHEPPKKGGPRGSNNSP